MSARWVRIVAVFAVVTSAVYAGGVAESPGATAQGEWVCGAYDQTAKRNRTPEADGDGRVFPIVTIHGITGSDDNFDGTIDKSYGGANPQPPRSLLDAFAGNKSGESLPPGLDGVRVFSFSYTPDSLRWVDHPKVGGAFAETIDCLHRTFGVPVSVVAHSMGGLVTRWVANSTDADGVPRASKLGKVITLGTPYTGSDMSAIANGATDSAGLAAPLVSFLNFLCGSAGTATGEGSCGPIPMYASFRSEAGRALRTGSDQIRRLARWPAGVDVAAIAGSEVVPLLLLGSPVNRPFDLGDLAVSTPSATADPGPARVFTCRYDSAGETAFTTLKEVLRIADPLERRARLTGAFLASPCYHSSLMRNVELTNEVLGQLSDWLEAKRTPPRPPSVLAGGVPDDCRIRELLMFEPNLQQLFAQVEGGDPDLSPQTYLAVNDDATIQLPGPRGPVPASLAELTDFLNANQGELFVTCWDSTGYRWIEPAPKGTPVGDDEPLTPEGVGTIRVGMSLAEIEVALGRPVAESDPLETNGECVYLDFGGGLGGLGSGGMLGRVEVFEGDRPAERGIRVGSSADDVRRAFGDELDERPHPYVSDGQYLTYRPSGDPDRSVIFETSAGEVTSFRGGYDDWVELIEGCV